MNPDTLCEERQATGACPLAADGGMWVVLWHGGGRDCVLDFEDKRAAQTCAVALAELGRERISIVGPVTPEIAPELVASAKERVWARLLADRGEEMARLRLAKREMQREIAHLAGLLQQASPALSEGAR